VTDNLIDDMAEQLGQLLVMHGQTLTVAESCTGGGLAEVITRIPGSSQWFDCGFVTYSNVAKQEVLGVDQSMLTKYGAVSEEIACAMAEGALVKSHAQVSVSITGIAGPDGGTEEKPVGTVCLAWLRNGDAVRSTQVKFDGGRLQIRHQACLMALQGLIDILER